MNNNVNSWIGKTIKFEDEVTEYPVRAMAALFDYEYDKNKYVNVPYGWHWLYF